MSSLQDHRHFSVKLLHTAPVAIGEEVMVRGWVKTKRDSKAGMSFIHIYDGSCFDPIQVVVPDSLPIYKDEVLKLTSGCSVEIVGKFIESRGRGQDYEVKATDVKVLGWVEDPLTYPMQPKDHSPEFLRAHAHLRPRSMVFSSVMRVRHVMSMATHEFFHKRGFFWIHTPILTGSDCEGAGEMFTIQGAQEYFGKDVGLTVSGQLSVEPFALAMSKVYTFGPTFRAEKSSTSRHLSEFWMVEPEIAFAELDDVATIASAYIQHIFRAVLEQCPDELTYLSKQSGKPLSDRLRKVAEGEIPQITYTDAIVMLEHASVDFEFPVHWGMDLQSEHEKHLTKMIDGPVVVKDYPVAIKAFYMHQNDDGKTVAAMDLLIPEVGELIGGSQRESRYDVLLERMVAAGLDPEEYDWYLDTRRYGSVPHSGFGLGFERAIQYATGVPNIRDTIPYPRAYGSLEF
jgi:asparaginyl-tRNA synthetase